jgi:hypothetical protein
VREKEMAENSGLPDGLFSYQKFKFWHSFQGLGMEDFGTFFGKLLF